MDPERVRSYLQVACAGLGFDIGEVWWTSSEKGSSTTIAAIEDQDRLQNGASMGLMISNGGDKDHNKKKLHFVQLYTSKSYEDRRGMLINPPQRDNGEMPRTLRRSGSSGELEKHVLSPRLVDSIAETSQIVWANTKKTEGLLGRSDMRLQTAVGMPVAVDNDGNMCVVVMFSPNNVQFSDDAMEYLQFISECATSSTIPCLLPAFQSMDGRQLMHVPDHHHMIPHVENLGDGVVAQYLSFEDFSVKNGPLSGPIVHNSHDLTSAPKDCFGIPMLPSSAELGHAAPEENPAASVAPISDVFDEASYGVWSTIMSNALDELSNELPLTDSNADFVDASETMSENSLDSEVMVLDSPIMPQFRKERLEEFTSAFLGMSVFDVADVWIPNRLTDADSLCHVTSVVANENNSALVEFKKVSEQSRIKCWSGAVGRAYSSGNPVWSANQKVIVDTARAAAFGYAKIQTAFAIPVFSARTASPACVVCCYSLVRSDSVPCVLRFVQQALRLLWDGLDKVEPHESVGVELWRDVAPADLGEMAADIEMQQHFLKKKRPHESISATEREVGHQDPGASLAAQFQGLEPSDRPRVSFSPLFVSVFAAPAPAMNSGLTVYGENISSSQTTFQGHVTESVPTVAIPSPYHQHRATNSEGTKRAHVLTPETVQDAPDSNSTQSTPMVAQNSFSPVFQEGIAVPLNTPSNVPSQIPQPSNFSSGQTSGIHQPGLSTANGQVLLQPVASFMVQSSPFSPVVPSLPVGFLFGQPPVRETVSIQQIDDVSASGFESGSSAPFYSSNGQYNEYTEYDPSKAVCAPCTSADVDFNENSSLDSGNSGKRCRIQGCADPAVARRPYCVQHSGNRLCEHSGCKKCAQGSTRYCIAHGGGRRCTFAGCDKGARDKFFCAAHGGGKRCKFETCSKSAVGGSNFCTAHGGGRRCAVAGCDKSAQSSTSFCVKHGGGKKCANPECEKVARGRTNFCAAHGGGVRCKLEGCNRVAIGKLQLCRTHGGGARKKSSSTGSPRMSPSASLSSFGSEQQSPIALSGMNGLASV